MEHGKQRDEETGHSAGDERDSERASVQPRVRQTRDGHGIPCDDPAHDAPGHHDAEGAPRECYEQVLGQEEPGDPGLAGPQSRPHSDLPLA